MFGDPAVRESMKVILDVNGFNFILSKETLQIEVRVSIATGILEDSRKEKRQSNHESTKFGKHEKGPGLLYNPFFFRAFVLSPAPWNAVVLTIPLGCFRDKGFLLHFGYCILSLASFHSSIIPVPYTEFPN